MRGVVLHKNLFTQDSNPASCIAVVGANNYASQGHDQLLEIRLLKKTGRHNFSFARHHSSNNYFFVNCSVNQLIFGDQLDSSSFTFRQKNINCWNCKWSTKVLENINCSRQFIVKKMVYMYGS